MTTIQLILHKLDSDFWGNTDEYADTILVNDFTTRMSAKLSCQREEGYGGWWDNSVCSIESLKKSLVEHIEKGDMVDVANFAAMIHARELDQQESELTTNQTNKGDEE